MILRKGVLRLQESGRNTQIEFRGYVGIHSSGFRDFPLKPELLRAIVDSGFEHPSEVQHECIPQAILGIDVICQAKSGMGKMVVFVLSIMQQIELVAGQVVALVLCHTRKLAYQICHEFERFSTYLPDIKVVVFYGGVNIKIHKDLLKNECPHIIVGTPRRILAVPRDKDLSVRNVRHFILDECDKMLESLDMRRDVQEIFKMTPHDKQVMMFSATLSKEIRPLSKKFMQDGGMLSPYYYTKFTRLVLRSGVMGESGQFKMACPHAASQRKQWRKENQGETRSNVLYQRVSARFYVGDAFVVPTGHPNVIIASQDSDLQVAVFGIKGCLN